MVSRGKGRALRWEWLCRLSSVKHGVTMSSFKYKAKVLYFILKQHEVLRGCLSGIPLHGQTTIAAPRRLSQLDIRPRLLSHRLPIVDKSSTTFHSAAQNSLPSPIRLHTVT